MLFACGTGSVEFNSQACEPVGDGGTRFDDACQFLPDGMLSYWFRDWRQAQLEDPGKTGPMPILVVMAARQFKAPPKPMVHGQVVGVRISDYGRGRVTAETLGISGPPDEWIEGQAFWHYSSREDRGQTTTDALQGVIDNRFLLIGSRLLLKEALARHGNRLRLLKPFGETPGLDWSAPDLVFSKPRLYSPDLRNESRHAYSILVVSKEPWRIEGWYLEGKIIEDFRRQENQPDRFAGRYLVRTFVLEFQNAQGDPEDESTLRNLVNMMLITAYGLRTSF